MTKVITQTMTSSRVPYQRLAIFGCILLSLAMIANNQMCGEGMWFWYVNVFKSGVKLYSQLHIALQPLYILELSAWMRLVGVKLLPLECLSLLHIFAMCAALFLILRESDWPDGLKALVLFGAFSLTVSGHSYRFDDYHVIAEALIFFALLLLLVLARTLDGRRMLTLTATLGLVTGLTITSRLTDGAALIAASLICLCFLLRLKKAAGIGLYLLATALTILLVVHLTGDTFSDYVSNSMVHAAGSKGGSGSILMAPFLMLGHTLRMLVMVSHKETLGFLFILLGVPVLCRFWKVGYRHIIALDIAALLIVFAVSPRFMKLEMLHGATIATAVLLLTSLLYLLPILVLFRLLRARSRHMEWDRREVLVILPLAEWASYSAGAAAEPLTNYYAPVALLLLLVPVFVIPYLRGPIWWKSWFAGFLTILSLSSVANKILVPYQWQNYAYGPMFVNRQIYHHPVYGTLYINNELLQFSEAVCNDIDSHPGQNQPELLSLPYPFPNYFCATPPWHNYVQTFFDTTPRATIEKLIGELNTAPPQYIVYQRQLNILSGAEMLYNHGRPLAQRDLDSLLMQKIDSGQWTLIEKRKYLEPGEGWYIIRTRP